MAILNFVASAGLTLVNRSESSLTLLSPDGTPLEFEVLFTFPFSSEAKRMGCIVRHRAAPHQTAAPLPTENGQLLFFLKGAESVILPRLEVKGAHWLQVNICVQSTVPLTQRCSRILLVQEECDNFAREGLRTLVIAMRVLDPGEFHVFCTR